MPIHFSFQKQIILLNRQALKSYLIQIIKSKKKTIGDLRIIFCQDSFLLDINRKFLQHNFFTDIITFDSSDCEDMIAGELYISVDTVKENAQIFNVTLKQELHRVIFHGLLHLLGFNDKTNTQKQLIRAKENELLKDYFDKCSTNHK